jgi:hypothetical protein
VSRGWTRRSPAGDGPPTPPPPPPRGLSGTGYGDDGDD